jgi:hypothetical protein
VSVLQEKFQDIRQHDHSESSADTAVFLRVAVMLLEFCRDTANVGVGTYFDGWLASWLRLFYLRLVSLVLDHLRLAYDAPPKSDKKGQCDSFRVKTNKSPTASNSLSSASGLFEPLFERAYNLPK